MFLQEYKIGAHETTDVKRIIPQWFTCAIWQLFLPSFRFLEARLGARKGYDLERVSSFITEAPLLSSFFLLPSA